MAVAKKTRKGKARENRTKNGPRTGVKTSGKTNNTPGWPSLNRSKSHCLKFPWPERKMPHLQLKGD